MNGFSHSLLTDHSMNGLGREHFFGDPSVGSRGSPEPEHDFKKHFDIMDAVSQHGSDCGDGPGDPAELEAMLQSGGLRSHQPLSPQQLSPSAPQPHLLNSGGLHSHQPLNPQPFSPSDTQHHRPQHHNHHNRSHGRLPLHSRDNSREGSPRHHPLDIQVHSETRQLRPMGPADAQPDGPTAAALPPQQLNLEAEREKGLLTLTPQAVNWGSVKHLMPAAGSEALHSMTPYDALGPQPPGAQPPQPQAPQMDFLPGHTNTMQVHIAERQKGQFAINGLQQRPRECSPPGTVTASFVRGGSPGQDSSEQPPARGVDRGESGLGPLLHDNVWSKLHDETGGQGAENLSFLKPQASTPKGSLNSLSKKSGRRSSLSSGFNPFRKRFQKFGETTVQRCESFQIELQQIKFDKMMGEGANGAVFSALIPDVYGTQKVAVKSIKPTDELQKMSHETQTLIKEVRILSKDLNHPNIVQLLAIAVHADEVYIAMELMEGGDLEKFFANRKGERVELLQAMGWAAQLFSALDFLHSKSPKIIHRDLKPANMLLSHNAMMLKLADFGLSRTFDDNGNVNSVSGPLASMGRRNSAMRAPKDHSGATSSSGHPRTSGGTQGTAGTGSSNAAALTSLTSKIGTFRYMAPEMFAGSKFYDEKIDIFSAALIVWFMVTGQRPWHSLEGKLVAEMTGRQRQRPVLDPKIFPKTLMFALKLGWAHEPSDRPSAHDMLEHLVDIAGTEEQKSACCPSCSIS